MSLVNITSPSASTMDQDSLGSPDPLASSPVLEAAGKRTKHQSKVDNSLTSRRAYRSIIEDISILPPSSPSKTVTEQTLSPWKIRVTVETEPEEQSSTRPGTMTTTRKIPLKQGSPPSNRKVQSRSRTNSASNSRQRSATPIAERKKRQSLTDLDIIVLGDDDDEDEWGKRPRRSSPRKSRGKTGTPKPANAKPESRKTPNFEVRQDTDAEIEVDQGLERDSPELRQIDLNKVSVRARSNSTKAIAPASEDDTNLRAFAQTLKPMPWSAYSGRRTVSANSAMTYPTPSPTASERGRSVEADAFVGQIEDNHVGLDTIMESEGFTMIDLDTIPSVRRILSSPSSNDTPTSEQRGSRAQSEETVRRHSPATAARNSPRQSQLPSAPAPPPHLVLPEDDTEISSTLPSSPPESNTQTQIIRSKQPSSTLQVPIQPRNRQVTPQILSSPSLPSPPRQTVLKDRSTPDSAKAMKAALLLQNAMQPDPSGNAVQPHSELFVQDHPKPRSGSTELFDGFDVGTMRELRAGLRFGEALAKRQNVEQIVQEVGSVQEKSSVQSIWRGESVMSGTPTQAQIVPEQPQSDLVSSTKRFVSEHSAAPLGFQPQAAPLLQTNTRLERQWQMEQGPALKHIQKLSFGNAIHNSDSGIKLSKDNSIDETNIHDEEGDIWLEEAKDASSSPRVEESHECNAKYLSRSTKSYKRNSKAEKGKSITVSSQLQEGSIVDTMNNTMTTNGDDMSGMLWKARDEEDFRFGAAALSDMRKNMQQSGDSAFLAKRISGTFDIDKMLGTPKTTHRASNQEQGPQTTIEELRPYVHSRYVNLEAASSGHDQGSQDNVDFDGSEISNETDSTSTQRTEQIAVNFNDSTLSHAQSTPPAYGSRSSASPATARPPTPRSAMKGARQSFGVATDKLDGGERRVIFAGRSKGVNVDWVESSSTIHSSSADVTSSPIVEHQRHHQERQIVLATQDEECAVRPEQQSVASPPAEKSSANNTPSSIQEQPEKGWLGWVWKNEQQDGEQQVPHPSRQIDGTSDQSGRDQSSGKRTSSKNIFRQSNPSKADSPAQIPSYLLPPSYPSDPTRSSIATKPLSTSGQFADPHFRTLHILHRKSQRPRFHGPTLQSCRPEICHLVRKKWRLSVDESDAGLGGFQWTVGEVEARVLERFCREVEFDSIQRLDEESIREKVGLWCSSVQNEEDSLRSGKGIWSGEVRHGHGSVKWGWTIEELATWLGRTVVGEVVREEEYGGSRYKA